jgi:SAM-dependent methyltransferase
MESGRMAARRVSLPGRLLNRRTTNAVRVFLDQWLPPVIRESPPFAWAVKRWLGPNAFPDFKYRAFRMSDSEFSAAYAALRGAYAERSSDTTEAQADWILANLGEGSVKVLEIGPGNGFMTRRLRRTGHDVWVLDIHPPKGEDRYVTGTVEKIPLPDKSVDIIVAAHVIEHARSLTSAFLELERVTRDHVLIVTPQQRFYRWTFDYHLHFFYSVDHLASHTHRGQARGCTVDSDLCLRWDVNN